MTDWEVNLLIKRHEISTPALSIVTVIGLSHKRRRTTASDNLPASCRSLVLPRCCSHPTHRVHRLPRRAESAWRNYSHILHGAHEGRQERGRGHSGEGSGEPDRQD